MAKETVERVKNAEEEALKIVAEAEQNAAASLAAAGEEATKNLDGIKAEEAQKMRDALDSAQKLADEDFETFKTEVSAKCEKRRNEIFENSEKIIGRIIEAVKKG